MAEREISYVRLSEIRGADVNPKKHDRSGLERSIAAFGLAELPLLDERTGRIVAGHGRIDDLRERQAQGQPAPDGVRVDSDGQWWVPLQSGWRSESDAHARAYVAASNKLSENGGWDPDLLPAYLAELNAQDLLDLTGFTDDELAKLLEDDGLGPGFGDDDEPGGGTGERVCETGDVWLLGEHRLTVGDPPAGADAICRAFQSDTGTEPIHTGRGEPHDFLQ